MACLLGLHPDISAFFAGRGREITILQLLPPVPRPRPRLTAARPRIRHSFSQWPTPLIREARQAGHDLCAPPPNVLPRRGSSMLRWPMSRARLPSLLPVHLYFRRRQSPARLDFRVDHGARPLPKDARASRRSVRFLVERLQAHCRGASRATGPRPQPGGRLSGGAPPVDEIHGAILHSLACASNSSSTRQVIVDGQSSGAFRADINPTLAAKVSPGAR